VTSDQRCSKICGRQGQLEKVIRAANPSTIGNRPRRTPKRYEIRCQLLLITNKKSHTGFRLIPTSVTLNGVIALILRFFHRIRLLYWPIMPQWLKTDLYIVTSVNIVSQFQSSTFGHNDRDLKTFLFHSVYTGARIDFVMHPRSSSRGRNTSASVTVTTYPP